VEPRRERVENKSGSFGTRVGFRSTGVGEDGEDVYVFVRGRFEEAQGVPRPRPVGASGECARSNVLLAR
jgi:hypothetical protein